MGAGEDRAVAAESPVSLPRGGEGYWDPEDLGSQPAGPPREPQVKRTPRPVPSPQRHGSRRFSQALEESQPVPGARVGKEKEDEQQGRL